MTIDVKGLGREYLLIIVLNILNLGTEFGCWSEIQRSRTRYQKWLKEDFEYVSNRTTGFGLCTSGYWDKLEYKIKVDLYGTIIDVYLFFLIFSGVVFVSYILTYLWFVLRAWHKAQYIEENRDHIVRIKFAFGFVLSFVLDIPGSCMAVVLYTMRYGEHGLHCWDCAQDETCNKKQELEHRIYIAQVVIVVMFLGLLVVSLWKGITTFYRWSKTDKVDCWQVRGCVALFIGTYYAVIILTPALGAFKYRLFNLPSAKNNVFATFTDSLFMIGMLGWVIFMVVGFCFPLVRCIRTGSSTNNLNSKTYQMV